MEQSAVVRSTLVLLVLLFASPVNSCGAGQFSGCLGCYNCPSGRWANGDSECCFGGCNSYCAACPSGYYCNGNGGNYIACGCGNECPGSNSGPTQCPAGTYASSTTATSCTACPAGTYCPSAGTCTPTQCPAGTYSSSTSLTSACSTACPAGSYCPAGSSAPTACSAGKFSSSTSLGSDCTNSCPAGTYCPAGSSAPTNCPAGTYGSSTGLQTSSCSGTCPQGYYCLAGSSTPSPCPSGTYGSTTGLTQLSACTNCPGGTYSSATGLSSVCASVCPVGYYCPAGSSFPTACASGVFGGVSGAASSSQCGSTICPAGSYCPAGSASPFPCPAGTYSSATGLSFACTTPCTLGSYCPAGTVTPSPCPGGRYGNSTGLQNSNCSAVCPPGFYCAGGTTTPLVCPAGSYCPSGSAGGVSCPAGRFGNATGLQNANCTSVCPAGSFCVSGSTTFSICAPGSFSSSGASACSPCTPGNYCPSNSSAQILCPGGTFGSSYNLTNSSCSGSCPSGFSCPAGTVSPTVCSAGSYSVGGQSACTQSPLGFYATVGASLPTPCPPGSYGSSMSLTNSTCSGLCMHGNYCPLNSSAQIPCAVGTYQPNNGSAACLSCPTGQICPLGCSTPGQCPSGTYNPSGGSGNSSSCLSCPQGAWCGVGSTLPTNCTLGTYSSSSGAVSSAACISCSPGYMCPVGSSAAIPCPQGFYCDGSTAMPCGAPSLYCPPVASVPTVVTAGYYSTPLAVSNLTRYNQTLAGPGSFAVSGIVYQCPAGRFGTSYGQTSSLCDGVCPAGYYCGNGTITPSPCGNASVYCPLGSAVPTLVTTGYYTFGGVNGTNNSAQAACPAGQYCVNGAQIPCPAATFRNAILGTSVQECSVCPSGFACALGSAQPISCGSDQYYCPVGTAAPLLAPAGYFTVGSPGARSNISACSPGYYCPGDGSQHLCVAGSFGNVSGLSTPTCSGHCANGSVCTAGSTSLLGQPCAQGSYCQLGFSFSCPIGTYNPVFGAANSSACSPCPPGTYNALTGAADIAWCFPCVAPESSLAGAGACWPGVLGVAASDTPPIFPGLSVGDVITVYFTKETNEPNVSSTAQLRSLISFSPWLSSNMSGAWYLGGDDLFPAAAERLVITLFGSMNPDALATIPALVNTTILSSGNITDHAGLSTPVQAAENGLSGNWGIASQPSFLSATALPYGTFTGVDAGDVLLLQFDQPVKQVPVATKSEVDALLTFSSSDWALNYTGQWWNTYTLVINVSAPNPLQYTSAAFALSVQPLHLNISVNVGAGLTSFDQSSPPSDATIQLNNGTWGDVPCSLNLSVYSYRALQLSFERPVTAVVWTPTSYVVQYSPDPGFSVQVMTTLFTPVPSAQTFSTVLANVSVGLQYFVRVAATPYAAALLPFGPLPLLWSFAPGCSCSGLAATLVCLPMNQSEISATPMYPVISSVSTPSDSIPTTGGVEVVVTGRFLGSNPGILSLTYSGSILELPWHSYTTTVCSVVVPDAVVSCIAPPGVGGNFSFILSVDGGPSAPSANVLSYSPPNIYSVGGPGAFQSSTTGGGEIVFTGSNFGPVGAASVVLAWSEPSVLTPDTVTFWGIDCNVSVSHFELRCLTPPGFGASLSWQLSIDGVNSSSPLTSYAPPVITSVATPGPLPTAGGGLVHLFGRNFGNDLTFLTVSMTSSAVNSSKVRFGGIVLAGKAAVTTVIPNCSYVSPHVQLECVVPPGEGLISQWSLSLLQQSATFAPLAMAYVPPQVYRISADEWPTDFSDTVYVNGSNFGDDVSRLSMWMVGTVTCPCADVAPGGGIIGCASTLSVPLLVPTLELLSDSELRLIPIPLPFVYASWLLFLSVADQDVAEPILITMEGPSVTALSFTTRKPSGAFFYIDIVGSNFGTSAALDVCVSGGGLSVTISNVPCTSLTVVVPHKQLFCVTTASSGNLVVSTAAGSTSFYYDSRQILLPPLVTSVVPSTWSANDSTLLVISGTRFGLPPAGVSIPLRYTTQIDATASSSACGALAQFQCVFNTTLAQVSYADSKIVCLLEPGVGGAFSVFLGVVWVPLPLDAGYAVPQIMSVQPWRLDNEGGTIVVTGANFGQVACALLDFVSMVFLLTPLPPGDGYAFNRTTLTFPPLPRVDVPCSVISWSPSSIVCEAPPGLDPAAPVIVVVANQSSVGNTAEITYAAPQVELGPDFVKPPTAGGTLVTLAGSGFGDSDWPLAVLIGNTPAVVLWHNETWINIEAPPGSGSGVPVVVMTPLQSTTPQRVFSYQPPAVLGLSTPEGRPVEGNFTVVITGVNFYLTAIVKIGDAPCEPVTFPDVITWISLSCTAPAGQGVVTLEVDVGQQAATALFAYDPPTVISVFPSPVDAMLTGTITVTGFNFGVPSPIIPVVYMGSALCTSVNRVNSHNLTCILPPSFVGRFYITVSLAGQNSTQAVSVDRMCGGGYTGIPGENCTVCPVGGLCLPFFPQPIALPGFYPISRDQFVQCVPLSACPGSNASFLESSSGLLNLNPFYSPNSTLLLNVSSLSWDALNAVFDYSSTLCSPGYVGVPCSTCAKAYYRSGTACNHCPSNAYTLILAAVLASLVFAGIAYVGHKKRVNFSALGIGIDFLQIVSMFTSFNFAWPAKLTRLFAYASATTFNDQLLAPECSFKTWNFELKWYLSQSVPLFFVLTFLLVGLAARIEDCYRRYRKAKVVTTEAHAPIRHFFDAYCGVVILALYFTYFLAVRSMLSAYNCVSNADGISVLSSDPSIRCSHPSASLARIQKLGILSIIVYTVGIPVSFAYILFRYRGQIFADQTLRSRGTGNSRKLNPNYHIRVRYQKLYSIFRPELTWWRLVLMARKLAIAVVAIMFSTHAMFQASLSVGIIFVSYITHIHYKPFLDSLQIRGGQLTTAHVKSEGAVLSYMFGYNRLEGMYLQASMFILLSGMVFQSSYLAVNSVPYNILTYLVFVVLLAGVLMFTSVIVLEVYRSVRHSWRINKLMHSSSDGTQAPNSSTEDPAYSVANPMLKFNPFDSSDAAFGSQHTLNAVTSRSLFAPTRKAQVGRPAKPAIVRDYSFHFESPLSLRPRPVRAEE